MHKAIAAFEAIRSIATAPPGVDAGAFLAEIPERLFEILLTDFLAGELPAAYNLLVALNVITLEHNPATATRPDFLRVKFDWGAIPRIISNPGSLPQQVFGWGTPDLDSQKVLDYLGALIFALGAPVALRQSDEETVVGYMDNPGDTTIRTGKTLDILLYSIFVGGQDLDLGFRLRPLPASDPHLPGFALEPLVPSQFPLTMKLADDISLRLLAGTNVPDLFGLVVRPDGVAVTYPLAPGTAPPAAGLGVGFDFNPSDPVIVLGETGSTRLQFKGASVDLAATFGASALEITFGAQMTDLALVLAAGESDGFIQKILGDGETTISVPLGIEWSNISGVSFKGSGAFEVALYPHLSIGPIDITELIVRLAVPSDPKPKLNLEIGASLSGDLGPLKFSVEEIGLGVYLTFEPGNAGPFDVDLGFKPPKGAGLLIDAGVVAGGGFLFLDSEHGRYAGALQLVIADFLNVTAIGLIETKLPDGSDGFSLLVIITADFGAGIQLGFGFTLLAVGGLLGLNRSVAFQAVLDGVRTNAIASVMFPQDVIDNAPRIISDLQAFFPAQQGTFLIGPMAKLGWGEPTLVSLSLGVIIEIPPGDIAILGVLKLALPAEDVADPGPAGEFRRRHRVRQAAALLLCLAVRLPRPVHHHRRPDGAAVRLGRRCQLRGVGRRLPPAVQSAAAAVPDAAAHPARHHQRVLRPHPCRRLFRRHHQHGAVRHPCELFLRLLGPVGGGQLRLRRADPVLAVPLHRDDLDRVLGQRVRPRRLRRRHRSRPLEVRRRWHAHGTASLSFFFFSIDIGIDFTWGDSRRHEPAARRRHAAARRRARQAEQLARLPAARLEPARVAAHSSTRRRPPSCCIRSARCGSASGSSRSISPSTSSATSSRPTPIASR